MQPTPSSSDTLPENVIKILLRHITMQQLASVLERWNENHRHFHTMEHLKDVIEHINQENDSLVLAAVYHDSVYEPQAKDNEEQSVLLLSRDAKPSTAVEKAEVIIRSTSVFAHKEEPDQEEFFQADCSVLLRGYERLLHYENQIRAEYSFARVDQYIAKRTAFLRKAAEIFPENQKALLSLIQWVEINAK